MSPNNPIRLIGRVVTRLAARYLTWRGYTVLGLSPVPPKPENDGTPLKEGEAKKPYLYSESPVVTPINHDFVDDPRFQAAILESRKSSFASRGYHQGRWNFHVTLYAAEHAVRIGADIVMLGVFEGAMAAAIAKYCDIGNKPIRMYLVDTFTGNPEDLWTPEERKWGADSAQWVYKEAGDTYLDVKARFEHLPNVTIIRGIVPGVLGEISSTRIGMLYLDMNAALPERAAAEQLWEKVVPGGIVLSDDYGHSQKELGFYAQKMAFDGWANSHDLPVLAIPTGHGLVIKPTRPV